MLFLPSCFRRTDSEELSLLREFAREQVTLTPREILGASYDELPEWARAKVSAKVSGLFR